jgi:hypothetical protein
MKEAAMRSARSTPLRHSRLSRRATGVRRSRFAAVSVVGMALTTLVVAGTAFAPAASAATTVQLGTAAPFAVLAGTAVTDTPTSSITGDVGLSPAAGSNYAGLTQAEVTGSIYTTNAAGPTGYIENPALLTTAKNDLTTAQTSANGQPATTSFTTGDNQLGGQTLVPGVYAFGAGATANLTAASPLVLNGNGVFIFQASSSLVTSSGSAVELENGAQACNVFWTVGSSATLGSSSTFVGTLMALTSATLGTAATVQGRILAQNGAVTLQANTITAPTTCAAATVTGTTAPTTGGTTGATGAAATATGGTTGTTAAGATTATTAPAASGSGGIAAGATPAPSTSASTSTAVVPTGFPHTGLGGAAHGRDDGLIVLGALAVTGALGVFGTVGAVNRRRRSLLSGAGSSGRE